MLCVRTVNQAAQLQVRSSENKRGTLQRGRRHLLQSKYRLTRSPPKMESLEKADTTALHRFRGEEGFYSARAEKGGPCVLLRDSFTRW